MYTKNIQLGKFHLLSCTSQMLYLFLLVQVPFKIFEEYEEFVKEIIF